MTLTYLRSVGESERGGRVSGTRWWGAGDLDRNLCWLALASGAGDRDLILFSGPGDLDLCRLLSGTSRVSLVFGTLLLLSGTSLETGTGKYMSRIIRKPIFGFSEQVQHKPGCTTTEEG